MIKPGGTREHGTRACYMFGVTGSDIRNGCRCKPCCKANTAYQVARRHGDPWLDGADVRAHVAWLRSRGIGYRTIAAAVDVNPSTIQRLADGRRIRESIAGRILSLHAAVPVLHKRGWVPADVTWRLIEGLHAQGWTYKRIAQALGPNPDTRVLQVGRQRVSRSTAAKVDALVKAAAPDVWAHVHDQVTTEKRRSDARAESAERRRQYEADRYSGRRTEAA